MAEKKAEKQEVAVKENYLPTIPDPGILEQLKAQNLEGIIPDFEVLKIPTGGQLAWAVPTETGEDDYRKEVAGVVLDHYPTRVYWEGAYEGGAGTPPDCSSIDGKVGVGNPGGPCHSCPMAQFSQDTGRVPCKEVRRVYLVTSESILPFLIPLPPTSGASRRSPWTSYVTKLFGRGRSVESVITKFTLVEDKNKDGIKYSKVQPFMVRELTGPEKEKVTQMVGLFKQAMRQRPLSPDDEYNTEDKKEGKEPWE